MRMFSRHSMIAALAASALSIPATAAEVQIASEGPVVEVSAAQVVQSTPDEAGISAGVTTRARTAVSAMQQNAAKMQSVIARLRSLGIAQEDIQTSGVNLNPAYTYNNNQPPTFIGYDVTNTVSVTLRKLGTIGETLDALVAAGATNINGPMFRRSDDTEPQAQARRIAFDEAKAKAVAHARLAGFSGVKLLGVEEATVQQGYSDIVVTARRAQNAPPPPVTPIEPGRVGTTVQITAKYELVK
ncbi:MAG: SIMPL domain-containing protein [Novosphingobium sp.]|nr:SIMPL domain-containing protein [Novosphingobium sp.]